MKLLTPDPSPAEVTIPLFLHRASCGFPSPASDYLEGKLDLNTHCVAHPAATFYLRAEGESMTGVGILRIPAKLNSHSGQREHPDP
ncbi:hypothetical protein FED29_021550 [Aeromonas veronii]|nr:hypothetical protein [Aeromonas veronii]